MSLWKPATYRQVAIIVLLVAVLVVDVIVILVVVYDRNNPARISERMMIRTRDQALERYSLPKGMIEAMKKMEGYHLRRHNEKWSVGMTKDGVDVVWDSEHPEAWIDEENNRHWHADHGHWHLGPPLPPRPVPTMANQTYFNRGLKPDPAAAKEAHAAAMERLSEQVQESQRRMQAWRAKYIYPKQASGYTPRINRDPEDWEFDPEFGRHWNPDRGQWVAGPPPGWPCPLCGRGPDDSD